MEPINKARLRQVSKSSGL